MFVEDTPTQADDTDTTANDGQGTQQDTANQGQQGGTDDAKGMSIDDYKAALAETRKQAAKYRTERNELRPMAEKYREMQEANKTDAERAAERIAALEAENKNIILTSAREKAAASIGINPELIGGDTPEEIADHAEAIAAAINAQVEEKLKQSRPFAPNVPGENAGGTPQGETDWIRSMLK